MLIIERVESGIAVIETENGYVKLPLENIKGNPREGDIIYLDSNGYRIDKAATDKRRAELAARTRKLLN
jgi:hypothetical protein